MLRALKGIAYFIVTHKQNIVHPPHSLITWDCIHLSSNDEYSWPIKPKNQKYIEINSQEELHLSASWQSCVAPEHERDGDCIQSHYVQLIFDLDRYHKVGAATKSRLCLFILDAECCYQSVITLLIYSLYLNLISARPVNEKWIAFLRTLLHHLCY